MKAITIRQPWAEAVADGIKTVENRSQGFPKRYRGPLAIHASTQWSDRGQYDDRIRNAWHGKGWGGDKDFTIRHVVAYRHRPPHPFVGGHILAVCELVDIHPAAGCCEPWGEESYPPANPEHRPPGNVTHLVLEDVHRVRPIPAKGALGLWTPDEDLILELAHALAELCTWDRENAERLAQRGEADHLWAAVR